MKRIFSIIVVVIVAATAILTSCGPKDTTGPKIYILGTGDVMLPDGKTDTILFLYTKFVDPGIRVEDNATQTSNILITNNIATVLTVNADGYLRRVESAEIIYTATDDAGNVSSKNRKVRVSNISEAFVNSYSTTRTSNFLNSDTTYNSTVAVETRVAGRLRFPKVYAHSWNGQRTYFKVNADLYHPSLSQNYSETIGYLGTQANNERPFYSSMTYSEGIDSILNFTMLKIDAQFYTDSLNNQVYISGVTQQGTEYPLSRIEYLGNTKTIKKIVLELNVTKNDVVDRVTETYVPNW